MNNIRNIAIGMAILCCSSCCSSSLMQSGSALFSNPLGTLISAPGSVFNAVLGIDKDDGGFGGGLATGVTDPVGGAGVLFGLAQGKQPKTNIKQVDPNSADGQMFERMKDQRCRDCAQSNYPPDCTNKGYTADYCATRLSS